MPIKSLTPHNRKRRRARRQDPYPELASDRSYIVELPIEVLSNILRYVFPVDLLTLARANHYFRKTLLHPQQQHIWRAARTSFPFATIPDPVHISEMTVASLLFDTRICSICRRSTDAPLKSHVQPTRVCNQSTCMTTFAQLYTEPPMEWSTLVYSIVPSISTSVTLPFSFTHIPSLFFTSSLKQCRKEDIQQVLQDIQAGLGQDELQVKYNTTFEQTEEFNRYMRTLRRISDELAGVQRDLDTQMQRFAKSKVSGFKWKGINIINSPTYSRERRRLLRSYSNFGDAEWKAYPPQPATSNPESPKETVEQLICREMQDMYDTAQRRKNEEAMRATREAVKEHWGRLKNASGMAGTAGSVVPRWNEFQALPVVQTLLRPNTGANDVQDLKRNDSTLTKMIQANVDSWANRTQGQFRKILNVPIPKRNQPPEPDTVSPLDRVTSLFECKQCRSVGLDLVQEGTLTFRSAVKHRCTGASRKFKWDTSLFQPDQLGIQIARHAITLSGCAEDKTRREDMDSLGLRFLCKLCPKPIVLTYGNLIGHLKRHKVKELQESIQYLEQPPEAQPEIPSSDGMVEKQRRGCKKGFCSNPDSKDFFVCRHCDKSLLWNGLVSHVKEKHHFSDIRDEDFYPKPKPESAGVST